MKYKAIKVGMDYCADPLWVSEDGETFANGCLSEFKGALSEGLIVGLNVYQQLWEDYNSSLSWVGEDLFGEVLDEMQIQLAAKLKTELPHMRIFYIQYDTLDKWVLVEVPNNKQNGIYPTMVS